MCFPRFTWLNSWPSIAEQLCRKCGQQSALSLHCLTRSLTKVSPCNAHLSNSNWDLVEILQCALFLNWDRVEMHFGCLHQIKALDEFQTWLPVLNIDKLITDINIDRPTSSLWAPASKTRDRYGGREDGPNLSNWGLPGYLVVQQFIPDQLDESRFFISNWHKEENVSLNSQSTSIECITSY